MAAGRQTRLIPNSFQVPNTYSDELFPLLTAAELRCVVYAIRRIFGFGLREAPISLGQFTDGTKSRKTGEYLDSGTGLCKNAVIKALRSLDAFNVMIKVQPSQGRRATVWGLQLDYDRIDWVSLKARQGDVKEVNQSRSSIARSLAGRGDGRGSGEDDSGLSHRPQMGNVSGLSDRPQTDLAVCPTDHLAVCPTDHNKRNRKPRETKKNGKPSNATTEVVAPDPTLLAKDGNVRGLLDGLSGIKSRPYRLYVAVGYLVGVPDPQQWGAKAKELKAAKRMLKKEYTPEQILRCMQYHLSIPFWRNNTSMGMAVIQSKIDAWVAMGEPKDEKSRRSTTSGRGGDVNTRLDNWVRDGGAEGL